MTITDRLVLPADVILVPVEDLPARVRDQLECEDGDYAITRPRARTPSKIIDGQAAELLKEFQAPKTIVEAVISYSRARTIDPEETLDDAFPMIQRFMSLRLLVSADSAGADRITPSFEAGDHVAGLEVLRCVQVLEDTDLYQVRQENGELAALKILREEGRHEMRRMITREAAILRHLDGRANPALLDTGTFEGREYLVLGWCSGVPASEAAADFRRLPGAANRRKLLALCGAIAEAYAHLHAQNVIHSDVHPRNVLVDSDGSVKIIDYGLARLKGHHGELGRAHRGGVGFFFEPEYAVARRAGHKPPSSSESGEQYALAAMLYLLLTGAHYLDFSIEKDELLRQIAEDSPLPFARRRVSPWPAVEQILAQALSKDSSDRFASVAELASKLNEVVVPDEPVVAAREADPLVVEAVPPGDYSAAAALLDEVLQRVAQSDRLLASGLPMAPTCSVNYGAAGIAYAVYRIACIRGDPALLSLADLWAAKAARDSGSDAAFYNTAIDITPETVGRVSPYHTASGVHCVQALISQAMGDVMSQREALDAFVAASRASCENLDLTLGRSSTLLACSLLLDATAGHDLVDTSVVLQLGHQTLRDIWEKIATFAPIRECSELTNLGIAHGWAGLLYAIMRWGQSSGRALPDAVASRLQELAECAEPGGRGVRWPWMIRRHRRQRSDTYMPGWCNGSAGFVHLWTLAHDMLGDPAYLVLAEKAAWNTWEEPDSIGNLCCGFAGRAYGLLNLYRYTGEKNWLHRAQELANRAAVSLRSSSFGDGTYRDSLYKGEIGVAVLAADLSRPEAACMPLFEQEGWPAACQAGS